MNILNITHVLIPVLVVLMFMLLSNSSHLFHSNYKWPYNRPIGYIFHRFYMRIEWAIMKVALKIASSWLMQNSRLLRTLVRRFLYRFANGEIYTLKECYGIIDSLYKDYPHVYVGVRICPCRQAKNIYDKDRSNITDLTFVFSNKPGKKKRMKFTKFVSLNEAKRLLKKFDQEGFVHIMYGACARYVDGSMGLTLCNCKRGICIPMDLFFEYDCFTYQKTHNLAVINQDKCIGVEKCGKCLEYCCFEARIVDKSTGKIKILNDKCYGCALCMFHCPEGANTMKYLPENRVYFYENLFKEIRKKYKSKT